MLAKLNKPEDLTNELIQELGIHAQIYGHRSSGDAGKKMEEYNERSSFDKKWLFLAEVYEQLNSNRTKLAKDIQGLVESAFNKKLVFTLHSELFFLNNPTRQNHGVGLTPKFIAEQIRNALYSYMYHRNLPRVENVVAPAVVPKADVSRSADDQRNRYYRFLKTFALGELTRINDAHDPKYQKIKNIYDKLSREGNVFDVEELKAYTQSLREITKQHRDTGVLGFFKYTWARNPQSYENLLNIFSDDNRIYTNFRER